MVKIEYDFEIEGDQHEAPFLDSQEVLLMFEQTQRSLGEAIERKLGTVACEEHGQEPHVRIVGRYDNEAEDMDIHYDIDTCCKPFMARVVALLNARN